MNDSRPQSIFRTAKCKADGARFARIDNAILQDESLSYRARGIAAYLLSKPDDWRFSASSLASVGPEGEHALEQGIRELIYRGYITRRRERDEFGHVRSRLILREAPTGDSRRSAPTASLPMVGEPTGRSADGRQSGGVTNNGSTNYGSEKIERNEMTPGAKAHGRGDGLASPKVSKRVDRPKPTNDEALEFARCQGIPHETAVAFLWYQQSNEWKMWDPRAKKWTPLFDWQTALQRFAAADRKRTVLPDKLSNAEFHAWAKEAALDAELVNAWIKVMSGNGWRIRNPKTNRMEPVRDYKAACSAFCKNDVTQIIADHDRF